MSLSATTLRAALLRVPPARLLVWVLVALGVGSWWSRGIGVGYDLDVYLAGGRAVLDGRSLYDGALVHDLLFTYSPFAGLLFAPGALLPRGVALGTLTALSLLSYAVAMAIGGRSLGLARHQVALVLAAGLALEPVVRTVSIGQVNLVLAALVVVDCLAPTGRWRGLLVGAAAGIKIIPGVFVVYFLLRRDWASALRAGLGLGLTVLAGAVLNPSDSWSYWTGGFLGMGKFGDGASLRADNQSLSAALLRVVGAQQLPTALALSLTVACVAAGAVVARRQLAVGDRAAAVVSLGLAASLGSPVSWSHHWVWLALVLPVLLRRRLYAATWTVGVLSFLCPIWALPIGNGAEQAYGAAERVISAVYPLAGITVLVVLSTTAEAFRRVPAPGAAVRSGVLPEPAQPASHVPAPSASAPLSAR